MTPPPDQWLHMPLAIVGMDCRLPSGDGLQQFWQLLEQGGYAIERMPDSKLDRQLYFDARQNQRGKTYSDIGGFVAERDLDWSVLNITQQEASSWDPCHLNLCEVVARACRHAGYDPKNIPIKNTGVFVGHSGGTTLGGDLAYRVLLDEYMALLADLPEFKNVAASDTVSSKLLSDLKQVLSSDRPERHDARPYVDAGFASGLISKNLGLTGPHFSIDAACASSLVALAIGAMSLASGQTEMAIVGGASYNKSDSLILFSAAQSCSAVSSRPFDQDASGLISSEGYVGLLIKRLERAQADGDRIHAVIRGIGVSSDGRGRSLWAPRYEGQSAAIGRAYSAEVKPSSLQMIEAHATSTQVGDATEMEALAKFYAPHVEHSRPIAVSSVKSNIGHTLETAGLAGLIKTVLSINHGVVPPSINVEHPNESIPWDSIPFYIPNEAQPWPKLSPGEPRRAAVNAFGIGGLNVHVVVEQWLEQTRPASERRSGSAKQSSSGQKYPQSTIAVVGRGLVVPGANNVTDYGNHLKKASTVELSSNPQSSAVTHRVDFEYDWRLHKVPPKQVAQANPLQFMLLEAAEQALKEAGLQNGTFDRDRAAVVVGSIFGGDFGNALFAGLRLPEFRAQLLKLLANAGISTPHSAAIADAYEERFLKAHPALIDETGSFTSSTLASRIAKTFNLMGGAMAIDAGDVSGLAALRTGCWLLQSGAVSSVLCAAAQRALDSASLDNLHKCGRLASQTSSGGLRSGYSVGEGVVLLALKRLDDAQRDGNPIIATIDEVGLGFAENNLTASIRNAAAVVSPIDVQSLQSVTGRLGISKLDTSVEQALQGLGASESKLQFEEPKNLRVTGHLQGAQGLLDVINSSLCEGGQSRTIIGHTLSGQSAIARVSTGKRMAIESRTGGQPASMSSLPTTYFFRADTLEGLREQLAAGRASGDLTGQSHRFSIAVVAAPNSLASKISKFAGLIEKPQAFDNLVDQGVIWVDRDQPATTEPRIAFAFSGQGSQYAGMLKIIAEHFPEAAGEIAKADAILVGMKQPTFADMVWSNDTRLGEDVWQTQVSLLIADSAIARVLSSFGFRPDVVCGHSYGEIPAMLAAGCVDLETAIQLTWHRCQSVIKYAPSGSSMLSVQADEPTVAQAIAASTLPVTISHVNAPQQTVVGGKHAHVVQLATHLDALQIASRILPVPTAFHTPALELCVDPFRSALQSLPIAPPRIPLLSGVNNRFVSDPDWMRDGLSQQLVTPLRFVDVMSKMSMQGITHLIEVGPQRILTRLARSCMTGMRILSSDAGPLAPEQSLVPLLTLKALSELLGLERGQASQSSIPATQSWHIRSSGLESPVKHFDATQVRRNRLRSQSAMQKAPDFVAIEPATAAQVQLVRGTAKLPGSLQESNTASQIADIERILTDFVVEQTGYPGEIVELDSDLEADLGIDSIKKAQLLGELRELFPEVVGGLQAAEKAASKGGRRGGGKLAELRTLRDFVRLFSGSQIDLKAKAPSPAANLKTVAQAAQKVPTASQPAKSHSDINPKNLEQFVVDFVVEQTGYPAEIVELDADLEADLGIDSIKKAQLLGELRETFAFKLTSTEKTSLNESKSAQNARAKSNLDKLRTLRQILDLLTQQLGAEADSNDPLATPAETLASSASVEPLSSVSPPIPVLSTNYRNGFAEAMRSNLQALSARRKVGASAPIDAESLSLAPRTNVAGAAASEERIRLLSQHAEIEPSVINEFDDCLLTDARWVVIPKHCETHIEDSIKAPTFGDCISENSATVHWFAELNLPTWLSASHFRPIGVVQRVGLQEIVTPGSAIPLAVVTQTGVVLIASSPSPATKRFFAERFATLVLASIEDVSKAATGWNLPGDWSILAGEASRGRLVQFVKCGEAFRTNEIDLGQQPLCDAFSRNGWAKIGWDRADGGWVILARGNSPLDNPARYRIGTLTKVDGLFASDWMPATGAPAGPEGGQRSDSVEAGSEKFFSGFSTVDLSHPVDAPFGSQPGPSATANSPIVPHVAQRYVLRMAPAHQSGAKDLKPAFTGSAVIIGDNLLASRLESRLKSDGVDVVRPKSIDWTNEFALSEWFVELSQYKKLPHLFIVSSLDDDARISLNEAAWRVRRATGLMNIFWLCQKWIEHVAFENLIDDASLIAVSSMGGDFGLGGNLHSAEGGGINGLLKSILIESWMQGYRTLPIKTIDVAADEQPDETIDHIWSELAMPSYDNEIAYRHGLRHVIKAVAEPIHIHANSDGLTKSSITRGGTWICTGGARGITALAIERLAARYDLRLHLIGTAPSPSINPDWHELDSEGLRQLKLQTMTQARTADVNPVKAWQDLEKQLEIDATLRRLREQGIQVDYHSCDVANRAQLSAILDVVRARSGPIRGVLHGAGVGRDARFDRKQVDKVDQCISAKVDGSLSLMAATWNDPLEVFVGFGSISGRFGANGHTDYSLANEMMCKQINWLKRQRPKVRAIGFHWHAWGDVGMATKPETKLALEMINMQFMPAEEGVQHLIAELESRSTETEVLITDDRYYRAFYPAETLQSTTADHRTLQTPLLAPTLKGSNQWLARVNPAKDPFLTDHLLDGRPLLPFVIAAEMLYEAAAASMGTPSVVLRDIQAHGPVKFFTEVEQDLYLKCDCLGDRKANVELRSDFISQKGLIVDRQRLNFSAEARSIGDSQSSAIEMTTQLELPNTLRWLPVVYPEADSEFYVGWPLQRLRKVALLEGGLVGRISAPALIELAGVTRSTAGWAIPSAALDACLFAAGILAWHRVAPGSALPVRMGQLRLGRLPRPGEACFVHVVLNSAERSKASFDFSLFGIDGSMIVDVTDYQVAWIGSGSPTERDSIETAHFDIR